MQVVYFGYISHLALERESNVGIADCVMCRPNTPNTLKIFELVNRIRTRKTCWCETERVVLILCLVCRLVRSVRCI